MWVRVLGTSQVALGDDPGPLSSSARASPARSSPRWPSGSAATCPPTRWSTSSGARRHRAGRTARCTPTSPAYAACSSRAWAHGRSRACCSPATTATGSHLAPRPDRRPPVRRRGPTPAAGAGTPGQPVHDRPLRRTGRTGPRSPTTSTRSRSCSALWTGEAYADLPDHPGGGPGALLARPAATRRRGGPRARACSPSATTPSWWPPPSRPPCATRSRSGSGRCTRSPWRVPDARPSRWRCCGTSAECSPTSSGLDPGQELRDLEQAVLVQEPGLRQWLRAEVSRATAPADDTGRPEVRAAGWGTVGRELEVGELEGLLDRASAGEPSVALLVGEPGIGKSRLVERVTEIAQQRGFVVATGRCAQDDGAPPLWPWSQALDELGRHDQRVLDVELERLLSGEGQEDDAADAGERQAFRAWESIAREVLTRSEQGARAARPRGPALGRHRQPEGAPASARRHPARSAPGPGADPAAVPGAHRLAGRRGRGPGTPPRAAPRPPRTEPGAGRRAGRGRGGCRQGPRGGGGVAHPLRRQPVLPHRARPSRRRGRDGHGAGHGP